MIIIYKKRESVINFDREEYDVPREVLKKIFDKPTPTHILTLDYSFHITESIKYNKIDDTFEIYSFYRDEITKVEPLRKSRLIITEKEVLDNILNYIKLKKIINV